MRVVKTSTCNMVYKGNPREAIDDLVCERLQKGYIRSFWRPSRDDLALLNEGAVIALDILTEPIPPVAMIVTRVEGVVDGT